MVCKCELLVQLSSDNKNADFLIPEPHSELLTEKM